MAARRERIEERVYAGARGEKIEMRMDVVTGYMDDMEGMVLDGARQIGKDLSVIGDASLRN